MEIYRSKTPDVQEIIHLNIQPVVITNVQPVINKQICPVVHKGIQPVIHQEIQPIITKEIQPIIHQKIQPIIFNENQTNIEEIIQQLEQSDEENKIKTVERTETKEEVIEKTEVKSVKQPIVQPYISKEEKHITEKKVEETTERVTEHIDIIKYIPYIQYKNGEIRPFEKKEKKSVSKITTTVEKKSPIENESSTEMMEIVIAVNFVSLCNNINYPMACKKTDRFSKIEKKLYQEFPELRNKNIYFIVNGNVIDKSLTFEQNKIKSGNTILINEN